MKNCLVTKLKGTVNNDELLKLGEIRVAVGLPYEGASRGSLTIIFVDKTKSMHLDAVSGTFSTTSSGAQVTSADIIPVGDKNYASVYFTGNVTISILDKYNIKGFEGLYTTNRVYGYGYFIDAMNTIPEFVEYRNSYNTKLGCLKNVKKNSIIMIESSFEYEGAPQDVNDLVEYCPNIEVLIGGNLSGNLSSLQSLANLKLVRFTDKNMQGDVALLNVTRFENTSTNYNNFSWSSRAASKEMIIGDIYLATPADRKRMLVDNSNCVRSDQSTTAIIKTLQVDTTDADVAAALTRLRGKNVEVRRENNTVLN